MTTVDTTDLEVLDRCSIREEGGHRRISMTEWLAANPPAERVRPLLIRVLDRPDRGGAIGRALAAYLGEDIDRLHAANYPRAAARLAQAARARGDDPHADRIQAALIALMFCANCGRPLEDPQSIDRGVGPDCWQRIDPTWRTSIEARTVSAGAEVA